MGLTVVDHRGTVTIAKQLIICEQEEHKYLLYLKDVAAPIFIAAKNLTIMDNGILTCRNAANKLTVFAAGSWITLEEE